MSCRTVAAGRVTAGVRPPSFAVAGFLQVQLPDVAGVAHRYVVGDEEVQQLLESLRWVLRLELGFSAEQVEDE